MARRPEPGARDVGPSRRDRCARRCVRGERPAQRGREPSPGHRGLPSGVRRRCTRRLGRGIGPCDRHGWHDVRVVGPRCNRVLPGGAAVSAGAALSRRRGTARCVGRDPQQRASSAVGRDGRARADRRLSRVRRQARVHRLGSRHRRVRGHGAGVVRCNRARAARAHRPPRRGDLHARRLGRVGGRAISPSVHAHRVRRHAALRLHRRARPGTAFHQLEALHRRRTGGGRRTRVDRPGPALLRGIVAADRGGVPTGHHRRLHPAGPHRFGAPRRRDELHSTCRAVPAVRARGDSRRRSPAPLRRTVRAGSARNPFVGLHHRRRRHRRHGGQ